jgi:hypothetical protein
MLMEKWYSVLHHLQLLPCFLMVVELHIHISRFPFQSMNSPVATFQLADVIQKTKLIIFDKVPMQHCHVVERSLQDITEK